MDDATRINADFSRAVVQRPEDARWIGSPLPGVTRRPLDRIGGEVARATSVVRYAPDSHFSEHVHGGGEEILVLDGVFGDEHGVYPTGSYLRNPPGTRHAPYSRAGCLLLVKLHQFAPDDHRQCCLNSAEGEWRSGDVAGVSRQILHQHEREQVSLERWRANLRCPRAAPPGGEELYVLEGVLRDGDQRFPAGSWLRYPPTHAAEWGTDGGCLVYHKTGHLPV